MRVRDVLGVALLLGSVPSGASAQAWNAAPVAGLVRRAIERRAVVRADSGLRSYRAVAQGFVLFLGQLGEGLSAAPRLIKADQLALEVYWRAPGRSKQLLLGRRDRRDLPTDIQYHRDHLGIVQNNFGDSIRLGEGDEVRDVPHPLGPIGMAVYDFALIDSLTIELPQRAVRVYQVLARPKDPGAPRIVGTLFLDVASAELVRFRFEFTRSAYLDPSVEDIAIVLDNGLWEGRYWLPRRQEIEIRRRALWLDLPARGIIRGRWEIGQYQLNVPMSEGLFFGPEIALAPPAARDTFQWAEPLDRAIARAAGPVMNLEPEAVRAEVERLVGRALLNPLPAAQPGFGSISELLHVNRVEGLAPGAGWVLRSGDRNLEVRAWASYGVSDHRLKGRLAVTRRGRGASAAWAVSAAREVVDIGDEPVIAPLLNSILAQERGTDFGDYVLLTRLGVSLTRPLDAGTRLGIGAGFERSASVASAATAAAGRYRPNPALGTGDWGVARLRLDRHGTGSVGRQAGGQLALEGGVQRGSRYGRVRIAATLPVDLGGTTLLVRGWGGWATAGLPPHRAFVLGGRGSLIGEPFRAWGGRRAALGAVEWQVPVPFPAVPLGPFGSTGAELVVAPFVAAGWAGGGLPAGPWTATPGGRPVAGVALEWFHRLIRAEVGVGLRDHRLGVTLDLRRDLWPIL